MTYDFEEIDIESMSDEELDPILVRFNDMNREVQSRSVDMTTEDLRMFANSPGTVQRRFIAKNGDGDVVGVFDTRYPDDGTNPETLQFNIRVWPECRRLGAGTAMLLEVARVARGLGREKLLSNHFDTLPAGGEFARALAGVEKLKTHENVLRIEDLDSGLMAEWVDQGPTRAPGYSVTVTRGDWPEELFGDLAHLFYILERDMPMSEGREPREWTPDLVREIQEQFKDGFDALFAIALHDETGRAVGMSEIIRRNSDPATWIVTVTMVDPEHRGRSLGKWLKGAVNLAALEAWPDGVYEETGNAFTNDAMLAINHAMGFRHELTITDVEFVVDDVLTTLEN